MAPGRSSIGVRVRPNSHDFIRQLRAELGSKQYTFWVDVRARMGPATKDVREWAAGALQHGNASVGVGANMAKASRDAAEWRQRQRTINAVIPVRADLSGATRDVAVWREAMGKSLEIKVKADISGRGVENIRRAVSQDAKIRVGADTKKVKSDIATAMDESDSLFTIDIDGDTKKAKLKVREFFDEMQGEQLDLGLDIKTAPAAAKVEAVKKKIEKDPIKAQLDMDTRRARLKLLEMRIAEKAKKFEIDVSVKKSGLDALSDAVRGIEKSFGGFSFIRSLNLGPINLGKPTGLIGTITTLTSLAGLVPGVVTAVSSLSKVFMDLAGAASILPGAIGGIVASIATVGVATSGVGETFGAMFDLWSEGASEQASTASSLTQAHNSYRNAVVDEAKAQRDVGRARKESLHDLRDLNNELRGGVLNEAQAILDVQKARDEYAKGGFDNETDRLQAQLNIAKAEQSLTETREGNIGLQERANEASSKGVEGSDKVTDALEAQTRATQATAAAAEALTQASSGGSGMNAFNDMLGQLAPNAQATIMAVQGAKTEIQQFKLAIQDTFFEGVPDAITNTFANLLPIVQPGMSRIAQAMNQNILAVFDSLNSTDGQNIIDRILGGTADAQGALTKVIDPLVKGVGTLVAAGAEHLPQVVDLFGRLTERFATFIDEADKNGSLDEFMDRGIGALEKVAELGINAIKIVDDLSDAFGGDLLKTLVDLTNKWHAFLSSDEGQEKLKGFIKDAGDLWEDWRPILEDLPGIFKSASDGAKTFIDGITPFINLFSEVMEHAPWLVEAFVAAWAGSKILTGILSPILGTIKLVIAGATTAINLLKGLPALASRIPGAPGGPGVLTQPGTTPPVAGGAGNVGAGLASRAVGALGTLAIPLSAGLIAGLGTASQVPQDYSISDEDMKKGIDALNEKVPAGVPKFGTNDADNFISGLGTVPVGKWIDAAPIGSGGLLERAKRYVWLLNQPNAVDIMSDPNFVPPPIGSYATGGYTPWPQQQGKLAMLHGKEYVQPADTTSYYGVDIMRDIHDKKIPPEVMRGYGAGDWVDPKDPRLINPQPGILPSVVQHGASGLASINTSIPGVTGASPYVMNPVTGIPGPAPGPVDSMGAPVVPSTPGGPSAGSFGSSFLSSLGVPGLNPSNTDSGPGWGEGGPPVGLGGGPPGPNGEAPFDIRKFGIGPGPLGSGPNDWMAFTGKTLGKFGASFISTLGSGLLDSIGLGGIMKNFTQFAPLAEHFIGDPSKAQGPGAGQTNADVSSLINTANGMPGNPAYPGVPGQAPLVFDASTGSALAGSGGQGLQVNTARGKAVIQQYFPWATNIGGVRADALKWHPSGLALDVMIPGAGGLNDPTPPAGKAEGDALYAWLNAHKQELGIDYILWQQKDHFNHLHVNFAASGYPDGSTPAGVPAISPPDSTGARGGWTPGGGRPNTSLFGSAAALDAMPQLTRDVGGWLPTGSSIVHNYTGGPEMVLNRDQMKSFMVGGLNLPNGVILPPPPPLPPGPTAQRKVPPTPTPATRPPPTAAPKPGIPPIVPATPPPLNPAEPPESAGGPGPGGAPISTVPRGIEDNTQSGDHLLPAIKTGIMSTASTIGTNLQTAASIAAMGATAGATAGAGGGLGGALGGGGGGGLSISGLFQQGGKIATNVANVASSFLVGNITGGTTENPYGVTQRANIPSGGTKVVDASSNHNGDIYTSNLEEYFAKKRRQDLQDAQSGLGRWGSS